MQPLTRMNRDKLLDQFRCWLAEKGFLPIQQVLNEAYTEPEKVVEFLVRYGKELYEAGRPYSHYSETVNAVRASKPTIRRMMTGAWDLAFREEPGEHHTACPYQVLLAVLTTAIIWGWPLAAGAIALSWGSVCRMRCFRRGGKIWFCPLMWAFHICRCS